MFSIPINGATSILIPAHHDLRKDIPSLKPMIFINSLNRKLKDDPSWLSLKNFHPILLTALAIDRTKSKSHLDAGIPNNWHSGNLKPRALINCFNDHIQYQSEPILPHYRLHFSEYPSSSYCHEAGLFSDWLLLTNGTVHHPLCRIHAFEASWKIRSAPGLGSCLDALCNMYVPCP